MASSSIENPIGYQNGFANISLNYLDWSQRAENRSTHTIHKKILLILSWKGALTLIGVNCMVFSILKIHFTKVKPSQEETNAMQLRPLAVFT